MNDKNEEIEHMKAKNFELNQRIINIAEAKENPLLQNLEKMLDAKLERLVLLLNKGEKGCLLVFHKKYQ